MSDEACATCMAGAKLDGSCDRDAADCAGVAGFYCCVVDGDEECSANPLLLDFVSESSRLGVHVFIIPWLTLARASFRDHQRMPLTASSLAQMSPLTDAVPSVGCVKTPPKGFTPPFM